MQLLKKLDFLDILVIDILSSLASLQKKIFFKKVYDK